jgi:hypothetical protein
MTSLCVQTRVNNGRFSPIYFSSTTSHIDFVQVSEIFQVSLSLSSWSFPLLRSLNDVLEYMALPWQFGSLYVLHVESMKDGWNVVVFFSGV